MRRMWPEEFDRILEDAEEVTLTVADEGAAGEPQGPAIQRKALKVRVSQPDFERIWPLAEARYRLRGRYAGKAVTLITNNPHYSKWHPADGGTTDQLTDTGLPFSTGYVIVHFLLDEVRESAEA